MDITRLFKATLCTVKARHKLSKNILPKSSSSSKSAFHHAALEVVSSISKLRDFLVKHQVQYVGEYSHLLAISSGMSTEERDQMDSDTEQFIKSCMLAIEKIQRQANEIKGGENQKRHVLAVVEILRSYLDDVCKLYTKQKAIRLKQVIVREKLNRLQSESKSKHSKEAMKLKKSHSDCENKSSLMQQSLLTHGSNQQVDSSKQQGNTSKQHDDNTQHTMEHHNKSISTSVFEEQKKENESRDHQFSAEETQMFEEENVNLFSELDSIDKEIKNIESKVVSISELQQTFQEKVISQCTQIESIYNTAVATSENVNEGNEQIREAIKNSATFRVWILFFLVMCTFSLLFLDWYNV